MYYKVIKKFPMIMVAEEKFSYPDLQDLFAIIEMEDDYEKAFREKEDQKIDQLSRNTGKG